jgi:protein subunit release factor A
MPDPRVTDDRFVLMVEETDSVFDAAQVEQLFAGFRALHSEERVEA